MRRAAGELFAAGRLDGEGGHMVLVPPLRVAKAVWSRGQIDLYLGAFVGVRGLHRADLELGGGIRFLEDQGERFGETGLPCLIWPLDNRDAGLGEHDFAVDDATVVAQSNPVDSHATPPPSR